MHLSRLACLPLQHRKFVDVVPLNNDWSPDYKLKVAAMVQARNDIRRSRLGYAAQFGKKL